MSRLSNPMPDFNKSINGRVNNIPKKQSGSPPFIPYQPNLKAGPGQPPDNLGQIIESRIPYTPENRAAPEQSLRMAPKQPNLYPQNQDIINPIGKPPQSARNMDYRYGRDDQGPKYRTMEYRYGRDDQGPKYRTMEYRYGEDDAKPSPNDYRGMPGFSDLLDRRPKTRNYQAPQQRQPLPLNPPPKSGMIIDELHNYQYPTAPPSYNSIQSQMNYGGLGIGMPEPPLSAQEIQSQMNYGGGLYDEPQTRQYQYFDAPQQPNRYLQGAKGTASGFARGITGGSYPMPTMPSPNQIRSAAPGFAKGFARGATQSMPPYAQPAQNLGRTLLRNLNPVYNAQRAAGAVQDAYNYWTQ